MANDAWAENPGRAVEAKYGGQRASFAIDDLRLLEGSLPPRVMGLVLEWASLHREDLMADWKLAKDKKPLRPIEPLA